jgi:ribosomal-protein-alanine N-acetyltransferase
MNTLSSPRLRYEQVSLAAVDAFHSLVQDEHVRRYLMDGETFPREWSEDRIRDSEALFATRAVGLWLAFESTANHLVGFCGFLAIPSVHPEPQLVYAMFERFTGRGYAVEMGHAMIDAARRSGTMQDIIAGVDEVNRASIRVLEKLGFVQEGTMQGPLGNGFIYRLRA